jgi:hypothetical protein
MDRLIADRFGCRPLSPTHWRLRIVQNPLVPSVLRRATPASAARISLLLFVRRPSLRLPRLPHFILTARHLCPQNLTLVTARGTAAAARAGRGGDGAHAGSHEAAERAEGSDARHDGGR